MVAKVCASLLPPLVTDWLLGDNDMEIKKNTVDKMKCPSLIMDGIVPGFGVRSHKDGKKTFIFRYSWGGKRQLKKLGDYGVLTVEMARDLAREKARALAAKRDPFATPEADISAITWNELWPEYARLHCTEGDFKRNKQRYDKRVRERFGDKAIKDTTRGDIVALRKSMSTTPIAFNHVKSVLSIMWKDSAEYLPPTAANPTRDVDKYPTKERTRFFSEDEIKRLETAAAAQRREPLALTIVRLYLLTGLRYQELLKLQWKDIDFEDGSLVARETKNGTDHYLPLEPEALALFKSIPRNLFNPNVFVGRGGKGRKKTFRDRWEKIAREADVHDAHIHDLRRTFGARLVMAGVKLQTVAKLLNHKSITVTQRHYAKLENIRNEELRASLRVYTDRLVAAVGV
jgi:integrase